MEAGDDGEAYEVKVNKADGTEVKVGLDPHLHVVSKEVAPTPTTDLRPLRP